MISRPVAYLRWVTTPGSDAATAAVLAAGAGYLIGTISSADIAAKLATKGSVNLRSEGTGNPGGANAAVVLGKRWGYGVMIADIAKGALASAAGGRIAGDLGRHVAASAAVTGHCYPVWTRFRGGKGVATSIGQCASTFPAYFPADFLIGTAVAAKSKSPQRSFQATAAASSVWVGAGIVWSKKGLPNLWGPTPSAALPAANAFSSAVILSRFWADRRRVEAAAATAKDAETKPEQ